MTRMKKAGLAALALGVLIGGFYLLKPSKRDADSLQVAGLELSRKAGAPDNSVRSDEAPRSGEGASEQDPGAAQKGDSVDPEKQARFEALVRTLGDDPPGKTTRNLLVALSLLPLETGSGEDALTIQEQLRADPEATMDRLMQGMERLGTGQYWDEKWAVLTFMADLNARRDEFSQFTFKEFTTILPSHSPNRTEQEMELGTVEQSALANYIARAHYLHINGPIPPAEALRSTVQGIQAHNDPQIKRALAAQFTRKYPDMAEALKTALSH